VTGDYGDLDVFINQGSTGKHFPADNSGDATWFDSGFSSDVCEKVDKLLAGVHNYRQNEVPYDYDGPNSNSLAHALGIAGGFNPSQPPKTTGWSRPVPIQSH
jgi:hypothetical protein